MAEKLDIKDKKLLLALDMNARAPDSFIAKIIGLSKQITGYRIKRLEKNGIIKGYYPVIDHTKLGLRLYRIGIKLENLTRDKEKDIINYLKIHSNWIVSTLGMYDLWFALYVKDEYEFMEFWNEFYNKYGYYIDKRDISLMTTFWNFERSFILPNKKDRTRMFILGKDPEKVKIDRIDKQILKELTKNARQTSLELSEKIKETERVTRYRIKKLEEKKIILGYRPFVDTSLLGLNYYKIFIQLKNIKGKDLEIIRNYITQNPNVVYSTQALAGYDFELEVHFENSQELSKFIIDLKEKFPPLIKKIEYMEYLKEFKITYYPS